MMSRQKKDKEQVNCYIYTDLTDRMPKRYEMVRYSTWRIYAYNELQSQVQDFKKFQNNHWSHETFQKLGKSAEQKNFYDVLYKPSLDNSKKQSERYDNISHFVARMLYCREEATKYKFISMEKRILENRLKAELNIKQSNPQVHRARMMTLLKKILIQFTNKNINEYNIPYEQWNCFNERITFYTKSFMPNYEPTLQEYAKMPLEQGNLGLRKRRSYMHEGNIYISCEIMIDIIVSNYEKYLAEKLLAIEPIVNEIISNDIDNQFSVFLSKTIKQIYEETMDEQKMNQNHKLTLRNVDYLSSKFFPPCMLNLNQHLKTNRHLKHDGRRQLWTFFKSCGMDVQDNKEYFRRHFQGKVTASQMRTHMYNIEHAYGLQGQRKNQNSWTCRGIISNAAPKKGQHHGCPFSHWRKEQLGEYLRRNYKISQNRLSEILDIKEEKHFQIACGRLFEYAENNQYQHAIPAEITAKLGRSPHMFFEAGMELRSFKEKGGKGNNKMNGKMEIREEAKQMDIQF